jgi:hypothetical protein
MKNSIIIVLLFISLQSMAQRFNGGLVAGVNVSQIDGDDWGGYNKAGLVGGAYVFTKFRNKWGAQMEIRYAAKGSAPSLNNPLHRKIRLQYIELPLIATFDFTKKIQLQAGGSFGYLFNAAQNEGYGYETIKEFDQYAVDACVGGKYDLLDNLSINVRFAYSVIPLYAQYSGATGNRAKYNNVITFAFYYRIGNRY